MKNANYKSVPNCLRRYRKTRALKQSEVAEILGLKSGSIISRWESGVCLPSSLNVFKLALIYRTMVDALFIDLRRQLREDLHRKEGEVLKHRKP